MEHANMHMQDIANALHGLKLLIESERYQPGAGFTCKAKDIGLDCYAECLEKDSNSCPFSVPYGRAYYCTSPARVYIAKELEK
ncbi:MAG: hypothetical protein JSV01_10775 [Desulfobacterales bacterium]|nr:MAG: hypothetical protein JSV01_10775 [Desulfobacterales bacterium]UCG79597.1 MAG: hypothetical protein JSV60_06300 [Desulfobacterales bacterium]